MVPTPRPLALISGLVLSVGLATTAAAQEEHGEARSDEDHRGEAGVVEAVIVRVAIAAVVTGGAQGIGRACVERLASEGAKVMAADTQDTLGNRLADALTEKGHSVRFVHANVTERLDMRNLVAAAVEAYGRLDILVTCAGMFEVTPFLELDEETFDRIVRPEDMIGPKG